MGVIDTRPRCGEPTENLGYLYDAAANLNHRTNSSSLSAFGVNNLNELTGANGSTCSSDGNGNLTAAYGYLAYSYDDENELIQVTDGVYHSFQAQFVYDGLRRLRRRLEYTWNSGYQAWQLASETRYLYDGRRVLQERDENNNPLVSYTRGNDLSGSLEGAGGIGGLLARSSGYSGGSWGTHYEYHSDAGGNITALVDASQSLVAVYAYDPFGNLGYHSGTQWSANSYRFSSKEWMANSGLYYYGYRLYDPNLQRWVNRDPIASKTLRGIQSYFLGRAISNPPRPPEAWLGPNLYRFVHNAPSNRRDALGLFEGEDESRPVNCEQLEKEMEDVGRMIGHELYHEFAVGLLEVLQQVWEDNCEDPPGPPPCPVLGPSPGRAAPESEPVLSGRNLAIGAGAAGGGYLLYRGIRLLPSIVFPPLWETLPINIAIP